MGTEQFQALINGKDIWVACGIMVLIIVGQSIMFLCMSLKRAGSLGIDTKRRRSAVRAACITSIGPSLSPVIISLTMIVIVGAPNTWLNLNNIGSSRTELANIAIGANLAGISELGEGIGLEAWSYALWTCALNGAGWLLVAFFLTHRMEGIVNKLYARYEKALVSTLMNAAMIGLFAYLLCNNVVGREYTHWIAAIISAITMLLLSHIGKKISFLNEISLGISMVTGMLLTTLIANMPH